MRAAHYHRMFKEKYTVDGQPEAKGRLYAYTTVYSPLSEMEEYSPYIIGIIELDSGKRVLAQVTDCAEEDLKIGMRMELVFRKVREKGGSGLILYARKFRPARG